MIFIFPGSIIQLEIQHWRQELLLHEDVHEDVDSEVGVMGPGVDVNVGIGSMAMNNSSCDMGSGIMKLIGKCTA